MIFIVSSCKEYVTVIGMFGIYIYIYIYIAIASGTHDATHLWQSTIYKSLVAKEILQKHILQIEGKEMKPYIVGDSTYPLHIQIQKPL